MTQDAAVAAPADVDAAAEALRVAPEGQVTMTHPDTEAYGYSTEQAFTEVWEPKGWTRVDGPVDPAPVQGAPVTPSPATTSVPDATPAPSRRGAASDSAVPSTT